MREAVSEKMQPLLFYEKEAAKNKQIILRFLCIVECKSAAIFAPLNSKPHCQP